MAVDLLASLKRASELASSRSLLDTVRLLWSSDRQFTFPAFHETARNIVARLSEWGAHAETFHVPADGKAILGDWKMPMGWDCVEATLEIRDPIKERGATIANRRQRPTDVIMWSGATPPGGITAEVVRIADKHDLESRADIVRGRFVYTPEHPHGLKKSLADLGVVGVVTSWCRNAAHLPHETFWFNAWSDDPSGWAFCDGDVPLPGMAISPRSGQFLDRLLAQGPVVLKMTVDARYMESTIPVVSGLLQGGSSQEEILAIGHVMEPGANDNASGAAVILETLRALREGTRAGRLAPLRRSVRSLLVSECYGTVGFAVRNPEIVRRMVAGVNWDTLGRHKASDDAVFRHHRCPDASASVADTLMALLLDAWLPKRLPYLRLRKDLPFALTDNAYCDPQWGVHCVYVDSQDRYWHTSADKPEDLCEETLHAFATISIAYVHFLATAGKAEALWLAQQTLSAYERKVAETSALYATAISGRTGNRNQIVASALDHLDYVAAIGQSAIASAIRLVEPEEREAAASTLDQCKKHLRQIVDLEHHRLRVWADCEPASRPLPPGIEDIAALRPRKLFPGTPTYDGIPMSGKDGIPSPTWDSALHCALFWADGTVPFQEIARRVSFEFGRDYADGLARHFRFMAEHGLVRWLPPGGSHGSGAPT